MTMTHDIDSNVVPIAAAKKGTEKGKDDEAKKRRTARAKFGDDVIDRGFVIVPAILLRGQRRLGLSPTQVTVLLHLIDWWTDADRKPWTSKNTLSQRMGISERQFQRVAATLEKAGFLKRVEHITHRGKGPNSYDLSGLVEKLKALAPEFRKAVAARRDVERPGGLAKKQPA
jgi:predicted transcriptional regulator